MNIITIGLTLAQAVQSSVAGNEGFWDKSGQWLASANNLYLALAVIGTTVFVLQFVMSLFGGEMAHDVGAGDSIEGMALNDHEVSTDFNLFSLRSITGFIMFFGWAGYFWGNKGWTGLVIAISCGLLMMFMITLVIFLMLKLQHSGNISPADMIDQTGSVYLTIPGGSDKFGKVTIKVQSRTVELKAFADEELHTGTPVKVLNHVGGNCYKVARTLR